MGAVKLVPKVLSALVSFSVTIACSQLAAFAKSDNSPLSEVEQRLFFKTYSEDTNDDRLNRLEKRVFGTTMTGSFEERLSKVSGASQPQVNPDGTMTGSVSAPEAGTANNTSTEPVKSPAQIEKEEREAAAERSRIAAQAAKDEQATQAMSQGVELWRSKRGPEALEKFEQVIQMQPNNADAYYSAGIIYESTGNLKAAMSSYQQASSIQSGNREYSDAVNAVQKKLSAAANVSPKQAEINRLTEQANSAYNRKEFLSALDLYKQLDFVNPNQALVKYNIGTLYLQIKDPFTALQYYKSAATLNPKEQKYVAAYQKLQAGVNKEEATQEASNAQWTAAGYDLAHIGENPPAGNNQNQGAPQQAPPTNQGNFKRPVLNMGQQASQASQNGGMQQQMQNPMQNQMRTPAQNPMQASNMAPPQGFLPSETPQFPPTGAKPANSNNPAKTTKTKNPSPAKQKQPPSQTQQQQMPMQMQQQMQQMQMQPMPPNMQQPVQQQNYNNQGVDPAAAREMQAVLQQNIAQGNIPGNVGGTQPAAPPPQQNLAANIPVNNYKPNFTPSPGNQIPAQNASKNAGAAANKNFGFAPPPPDAAATYGIIAGPSKDGIRAAEVGIGSRASRAGLRKGDLIRAVDGTVLRSVQQLNDALTKKNGGSVQLYVQRNSQMATLTL